MGGLKESLAKFRKHHHDVGDALLNISGVGTPNGESVDQDEPRPTYVHQDYPRTMYHADLRQETVQDATEQKALEAQGFRTKPYARPQIAVHDPATEKKELVDRNRELQGTISQLLERLEALEKRK